MRRPGLTVWFTGLSGAGKSTICQAVFCELKARDIVTEILDADELRQHVCRDLGYTRADRDENVMRIGHIAMLLARNYVTTLVAAISPYREARDRVRRKTPDFIEVYVDAPLEVCEHRDTKGLYEKQRSGVIHGLTGVDDPYEPPFCPEVVCHTSREDVIESAAKVVQAILGYSRRVDV